MPVMVMTVVVMVGVVVMLMLPRSKALSDGGFCLRKLCG